MVSVSCRQFIILNEKDLGSPLCHDGTKPHCIGSKILSLVSSLDAVGKLLFDNNIGLNEKNTISIITTLIKILSLTDSSCKGKFSGVSSQEPKEKEISTALEKLTITNDLEKNRENTETFSSFKTKILCATDRIKEKKKRPDIDSIYD